MGKHKDEEEEESIFTLTNLISMLIGCIVGIGLYALVPYAINFFGTTQPPLTSQPPNTFQPLNTSQPSKIPQGNSFGPTTGGKKLFKNRYR